MAERPVFVPCMEGRSLYREVLFSFKWNPGFAPVQKKKNVAALHDSATREGLYPLLEISTKSELELGRRMSAFSLKVEHPQFGEIPLESAFQGSKVFADGVQYCDIYQKDGRGAKKDSRTRESGPIVGFSFLGVSFPTEPRTAFYDWLYISAIAPHREFLQCLDRYKGFTDIEFNPTRSVNCQARSCAIFVALDKRDLLGEAMRSPEAFIGTVRGEDRADVCSEDTTGSGSALFD